MDGKGPDSPKDQSLRLVARLVAAPTPRARRRLTRCASFRCWFSSSWRWRSRTRLNEERRDTEAGVGSERLECRGWLTSSSLWPESR